MIVADVRLKDHSWVTKGGTDPLLSAEENTADLIEPPTEEEMNKAITGNLSNLLVVVYFLHSSNSPCFLQLSDVHLR